ncbi:photosystem II protein, Psb35-related [Nodosilinea sp. AN01ver1]|uniref:photosystem II protein, Psb35-related n=1 Tax=Nodosilinea sp. AN01ver1 TaxID=3423362 RepID=UPI003D315347
MTALLISLFVVGWVAVALIGTQAYFRGEQTKPIHERNWRSESFDQLAQSVTGQPTNFGDRVPAYSGDAFTSNLL